MEHLRKFVDHIKNLDDSLRIKPSEELFVHLEETLLPHLLRVMQKDNTLLSEIEIFPSVNIGALWTGSEEGWKLLQMALLYAVLHGDPKEKFGKILETVKGFLPGGQGDEISNILADEDTQNSIKDFMEVIMNTRLASIVGDIVQSLQLADLDINFENPEQMMEMMRNPAESPVLKEIMERAQMILEDRIKSGKINQQELVRELETLRAKFQSSFGKYMNEALIGAPGNTTGNTGQQILSNHPEARRARMLARLQRKQQEKLRQGR